MIVAIWCGHEKPKSLNDFLRQFVNELNEILTDGIILNGYKLTVAVQCFICDTPARAFLKGVFTFYFILFLYFKFSLFESKFNSSHFQKR